MIISTCGQSILSLVCMVIGKCTASSSVVLVVLVYKPFNLATPIAGLICIFKENKS